MSAETDLLPIPMEAFSPASEPAERRAAIRAYARANLAELQREVEALRAEVVRLRRDRDDCLAAREHYASLYGEQHGRAERLAEALRHVKQKLDDVVMIRGCHGAFAGTYMIVTEALHPTAAQEAGRE